MPSDAATQSKNRDRFLFDPAPGWALGYDDNQWIILHARGDNAKKALASVPDRFLDWRDQ